jgi:hypothetical protein
MTDERIEQALDIVAFRAVRDVWPTPYRLPVPPAERAHWRRRVVERGRARGLDVFAIYRGGRAKALDIFVIREKGPIRR